MTTITAVSEKILAWQKSGCPLNVSREDLEQVVKEHFDQAMLLIASITDLQRPQEKDQVNYEAEIIQGRLAAYETEEKDDRWEYLKSRFEVLQKTGLLNPNLLRDLQWRFA